MKKFLFIAAIAALAFTACSKNEVVDDTEGVAVSFDAYAGRSTKADTSAFVDGTHYTNIPFGKAIGVYGYYVTADKWQNVKYTATPNLFNNVPVTAASKDGSAFTYSPARYWPKNTTDFITFYGYYPYGGTGITPTVPAATGSSLGSYAFTTQATSAAQVDFLVSDVAVDQSKTAGNPANGKVPLKFHHMLSQINATATASADLTANGGTVVVNSVKIKGVFSKGTLAPTMASATATQFTWSGLNTTADYEAAGATAGLKSLLLIPQTIPATATIEVSYTVTFNYGSGDVVYNNTATAALATTAVPAWEMNKKYTYNVSVSLDKIEFTSSVVAWGEETVISITQ